MPWFYLTFGIAVLLCIFFLNMRRTSRKDSSREKIARTIGDFIEGKGLPDDWDDFTSIPLKDPELDRIREACVEVGFSFPAKKSNAWCSPEGIAELRKIQTRCLAQP